MSCCNQRCNRCNGNSDDNMYSNSCQNRRQNAFPENYLYGHAYTPNFILDNTYVPEVGLENGSIFPELVSPYYPGQSIDFIEYLKRGGNINE